MRIRKENERERLLEAQLDERDVREDSKSERGALASTKVALQADPEAVRNVLVPKKSSSTRVSPRKKKKERG